MYFSTLSQIAQIILTYACLYYYLVAKHFDFQNNRNSSSDLVDFTLLKQLIPMLLLLQGAVVFPLIL